MTKRFVFFNTYNGFTSANKGVDYDDESIVFIKDRKLIYTNETGFNAIPDGGTSGDILTFDGTNYVWKSADDAYNQDGKKLSEILADKVSYDDLKDYYTKSEVDNAITTATDDMATQSWVESKGYLTEHQSLENYYTKSETDTAIETAVNDLNISQYETITGAADKYQPKGDYLTEHQDLTEYAKSADVTAEIEEKISDLNISQYETIEGAAGKYQVKGDYLTEHQDLTEYAKKNEVTSEIKTAIDDLVNGASSTMDTLKELEDAITGNKSIIDTLNSAITEKADKTEIADMATQTWVKSQEYLTEHQDISNLATKDEVTAVDDKFAGYYTKEQVDQKIEEIDVTAQLTDYATKSELSALNTNVNGLSQAVSGLSQNLNNAVNDINDKIAFVKTADGSTAMAYCTATGKYSVAEGYNTNATGNYSHAEGQSTTASGECSHAEGKSTQTKNNYEHASGVYNNSTKNSEIFGDALNTLFSVGNGEGMYLKYHNAIEIKQDGTIYVVDMSADGQYYEKPMIKLQDLISRMIQQAVGNIDLSNYYTKEETDNLLNPLDCGTY